MKKYLHAFAMCQSMFCAIPFPGRVWDEQARPLMLLFLPAVGLEIGLIWAGLSWMADFLGLHQLVKGLVLSAYPFLVTGFLHLDGYMDVTDAVKSCRDLQRRREILKDPGVGSFAVISVALLMIAQFALFSSADADGRILIFVPVVSRCGSALAVTLLRPMSTSQYAVQKINKAGALVIGSVLAVTLAAGFLVFGRYGIALLGAAAGYGAAVRRGYKSLDGMNGDISGYALTISELCAVAVYALI